MSETQTQPENPNNNPSDLTELTAQQKEIIQQVPPRQGDVEGILEQTQQIWPKMPTISNINNDDSASQNSSQNGTTDNDDESDAYDEVEGQC